jgi:hypothetical protein
VVAEGTSHVENFTHLARASPITMPPPDDVCCFLVGDNSTFSINIEQTRTRTVGHLKKAIKAEVTPALDTVTAHAITLYLINATGFDEQKRIEAAEHKAQDLGKLRRLDSCALLTEIFAPPGPSGPLIHILAQPPRVVIVSSIYVCIYSMNVSVDAVVRLEAWLQNL